MWSSHENLIFIITTASINTLVHQCIPRDQHYRLLRSSRSTIQCQPTFIDTAGCDGMYPKYIYLGTVLRYLCVVYFHFLILYASILLHSGGKHCTFTLWHLSHNFSYSAVCMLHQSRVGLSICSLINKIYMFSQKHPVFYPSSSTTSTTDMYQQMWHKSKSNIWELMREMFVFFQFLFNLFQLQIDVLIN